ncbi:hypothetical protein [Chryseobacterium salviniae]|uniref:Uncharacterized protein n=1 Tax=Chryseobacterium salviniae TaxID=3101750 RepID=A0ABU6I0R0_9FLAO|nr:hypothetical protein [Chryseobacterium sp. T9W2-O]MEC3877852.1 hypothetical protein [Chryseobacterium sp. T9W2-O]
MKTQPTSETETLDLNLPPNTMAQDLIQTLVNNYRNKQLVSVKEKMGIDDAHSIHFELKTLKKFIADIETLAYADNPETNTEDLGIRFYYAAYPNLENWDIMNGTPIGTGYAEKHTLVMVPTIKKQDENGDMLSYDFNPVHNDGQMLAMASSRNAGTSLDVVCQNHGALIPPDSTKTELF